MLSLLPWRRPAVEPDDELVGEDVEDELLDTPTFIRETGEWRSGVRAVRQRPLEWVTTRPTEAGWRCARLPGAKAHTVVCIVRDATGDLHYGVSAVKWSRVADSDLEWGSSGIAVPYGPSRER